MGIELKKKKQLIERLNKRLLSEAEMECPKSTQDLELNTNNRDKSIKADYIKYGPLNIDEPGDYWEMVASDWNTTVEAAKNHYVVIVLHLIYHQEWMNVCQVRFLMIVVD